MRLLDVARRRPLLDRMTVYRGKRKGEVYAKLRPEVQTRLERLGRERALIYKTLVLTGLRKGELASLTVGQLDLDAPTPSLVLKAADEKNRGGSTIPLRADLRGWLADKATALQEVAQRFPAVRFDSKHQKRGKRNQGHSSGRERQCCLPLTRLPADMPLFTVPRDLVRILDRDLVADGIARRVKVAGVWKIDKRDERGRTVDVHALRHTFGTLLSKGGVTPRTTQAAMRHGSIDLTMNVYTDPKLLDVAGAVESLPALPLGDGRQTAGNVLSATGTDDLTSSPLAPKFAPTTVKTSTLQSMVDKIASEAGKSDDAKSLAVSAYVVKQKSPLTSTVNGRLCERETGIEPATTSLGS
jgi:integrase